MAFTTPADWSVVEEVTSSKMNAQVRDNIKALAFSACVTAYGETGVGYYAFDTEVWDDNSYFNLALLSDRLRAPYTGRFDVIAFCDVSGQSGDGGGNFYIEVFNDSDVSQGVVASQGCGLNQAATLSAHVFLASHWYVKFLHDVGATGSAGDATCRATIRAAG